MYSSTTGAPCPPSTPMPVCPLFHRDLTVGSNGDDVSALQTFLAPKGFLVIPPGVTLGYFGPLTRAALAAYQVQRGISPAEGYFGAITRAAVSADCSTQVEAKRAEFILLSKSIVQNISPSIPGAPGTITINANFSVNITAVL